MTHQDESANADANRVVPSTRRGRRDGEREAQLRALYADAPRSTSMRVVDGGSPIYSTRREMRESAARLARDLPVTVEAPAATAAEEQMGRSIDERLASTRRERRRAAGLATTEQTPVAPTTPVAESAPATRRSRRIVVPAQPQQAIADERDALAQGAEASVAPVVAEPAAQRIAEPVAQPAAVPVEVVAAAPIVEVAVEPAAASTPQPADASAEQHRAASTPLRREARAPRRAVVARRPIAHAPVVRPSRRVRSGAARKAVQRLAAASVFVAIGSLVAVTSLPAQAFSPEESTPASGGYGDVEVAQQLEVSSDSGAHGAEEPTSVLTRDDFAVDDALASARLEPSELAALQAVADAEKIGPYFGGDPAMPNVWSQLETSYTQSPFPSLAQVPVSSGFAPRWGSFHGGVDLVPGAGTPIYPIANGVVIAVWQGNNPGGGGYQVIVEHNVDGQYIQAWYPHMQAGSIQVRAGQVVDVTTQLGAVGSTGRSTGAHLHLEIKNSDYVSMDPLAWLATRERILEPS